MLDVMRFWLDRGLDGFRCDAVPYLIEREGTSGENLPETHTILREFRRVVDLEYGGDRVLLAEANQWPEDVRPYFGDGDEFHMAFHFPLMPRLYMAIRREDRLPITDIFTHTPPIPPACQWCLFLRNHDELTLEMVTNEERDYMYYAYASDPQMKLNLGIRRRLAPLLDNDRRRIELLNCLLLTLPGSPIVYYGDEIGMGDNVYLGDRNGVRTPMQWSARPQRRLLHRRGRPALPAGGHRSRLRLPGGERRRAGERSPGHCSTRCGGSSPRAGASAAFGRGSIEFLRPRNQSVLAYLRRWQDDTLLIVANLSGRSQPVELDLAALDGLVPVEMLGDTRFPPIRREPYFLSLGPHGYYWLTAAGSPAPSRALRHRGLGDLMDGPAVPPDVLADWIAGQRWFAAKSRRVVAVAAEDGIRLGGGTLWLLRIALDDGSRARYAVPLRDGRRARRRPRRSDASVGRCSALIATGGRAPGACGELRGTPTSAFPADLAAGAAPRRLGGEQSNTSVVFGERLILKHFRRLQVGPNPEIEITRFLTERTTFRHTPRLCGSLAYHDAEGEWAVAITQELVTDARDGWRFLLDRLAAGDAALPALERLGRITAELHRRARPPTARRRPRWRPSPSRLPT